MIKENKVVLGVLFSVLVTSTVFNVQNASAQNNLLIKQVQIQNVAPKGAFSVSMKKKMTLEKYKNSTSLTDEELKELLHTVGFKGKSLATAWAVAKKESNGRPLAFNGNAKTGDSSYGIFQINMIGDLGPDRRDKFNLSSNAELLNPVVNAEIAYHMSNGGKNWSAWHGITAKTKMWIKKFHSSYMKV
jgi:hypothetical protein